MNKEKWVVEVFAGKEFVGKMTGVDGKVAVFDQTRTSNYRGTKV
ncbi:hypothetical protein [Bacillus inaquosorum]|nr:hypothetical protein [Bacillus inaquosorum]